MVKVDPKSLLINGKMGTLQKTLISQVCNLIDIQNFIMRVFFLLKCFLILSHKQKGFVEKGQLDSATAEGKAIVLKMLQVKDLNVAEKILLNMVRFKCFSVRITLQF